MHDCELQMYGCCNISKMCQIDKIYNVWLQNIYFTVSIDFILKLHDDQLTTTAQVDGDKTKVWVHV